MAAVVELSKLVRDNRVLHVCQGKQYVANKQISVSDVYRPGLELTGYFDFYPRKRTQLLGRTEISYAARLDHETRVQVFSKMCTQDTPCFLISRSLPVPEELRIAADQAGIPILSTSESTTYVSSVLTDYLRERLAHRLSVHGVLVEIKGMGILLIGDSGVGKSETALGLINRGHRLIADDRVDVYRRDDETLMGEAPKILRHLMEIRGLGIIDVMELFGVGAVKARTSIQLVINLVNWNGRDNYDRLGVKESKREYCDIAVPEITIPVKVGRNMEDIIEVAAMNFRAKGAGYDAAKTFDANLRALIAANSQKKQKKDQNKNEIGN